MCQPLQDGSTYLEVPLFIRQGPKKYQIDFLRGLFEGDGDLEQNHISYTTISKNLAYQISALLLNLGIYNSIDFKGILATNSSANQVSKKAYTIRIVGKFMKIFKEEIGFFSERKQLALDESLQRYDTKEVDMSFSYNKLPVPIKKEFLKFIKQLETSISQFPVCKHNDASSVKQNQPCELETLIGSTNTDIGLNDIYSIMHTDNVSLTTKKLKLLCGRLRLSEHYFSDKQKAHLQYFEGIADSIYVKVKRMRTSTQLVKTYDFALPDTHQFWSNGIISHNSGKSAWVADMSCYHTHRVLKLQNPNKVYDLKESNMLHATFVALTFNQAKDNLWDPFSGNISGSPWFQEYHKMLSEYQYKGKGKEELFRYKDTFLLYKHRRFICYPSGPDKRILRGRTRMLASIDELGWMDNEANSKKIKANAHEVYIALQNSLLTVRGACENLMKMGFYDIPHGLFLNISSPSSTRDKIMELVKQSLTSDRIYGKIKPTWEMNPRFPFNCKVIQEEFKKNPIAAMRDYGAQPPLNSSPLIESKNAIQKCIGKKPNSIKVQYAQSKSKDGTIRRYSIADTVKKTKHISVLALDAGYSKNAFACAVGHKVSDKLISIDLLTEVQPLPGMKLNFNKILKHLLSLIIDNRNCILVCADRWQSIKLLDDIEDEFGASTKQYSLKYNEFSLFKDWLYDGQIIFPQPETDIDRIISYEHSNYPMCFKYRPVDHFILQCLTVQDTGSSVVKGDNLTDDLFRAANLMFSQLLDPKNQDLFTLQEEAIEQTVNNLVIGVMRGLSSGSGRAVSEVNPQQAQLGLYKTRQG
jgi:hypothetical protein